MKRGAVIIGIDNYTDARLIPLKAAVSGAKQIAAWAEGNGFEVKLIIDTQPDANGAPVPKPVILRDIQLAVADFVERTGDQTLDQLLIYFAGHGINVAFNEYWLLSDAPRFATEVVNVPGSLVVGRATTGIQSIVFISDACRSAAVTIDTQAASGGLVFPSPQRVIKSKYADLLFASLPGSPAQEVQLTTDGQPYYEAVFSEVLLDALNGKVPSLFETIDEEGVTYNVVSTRRLGEYLESEVPNRVVQLKLPRYQNPDCQVQSELPVYLSRLEPVRRTRGGLPRSWEIQTVPPVTPTLASVASGRVSAALGTAPPPPSPSAGPVTRGLSRSAPPPVDPVMAGLNDVLDSGEVLVRGAVGRTHFESQCGFSVVGADLAGAYAREGIVLELEDANTNLRVRNATEPVSVLLEFENGRGCVLAAIPEYIGTLVFDGDELVNVSYEPAEYTWRWQEYAASKDELQNLRAVVAAASRLGVFRPQGADAAAIGDKIRVLKGVDPTLGLYAAYAYDSQGLDDAVDSVANYMRDDLHLPLFDVAMLERNPTLPPRTFAPNEASPFCPMLAQGWALLTAKRVTVSPAVVLAGTHLASSLWTLFEAEGVKLLRDAIKSGEVQ